MMIDRQFVGDIGLAIVLALPTTALLARPLPPAQPAHAQSQLVQKAAMADHTSANARISVLG